jgi:ketosteroid isomerase-like protein
MTPMTDAATIQQLETDRWNAMFARDITTLDALVSDDLVYTHSSARMDDKASYLALVNVLEYRAAHRSGEEVRFFGGTAILTGRAEIDFAHDGEPAAVDVRYTVVWNRGEDDQWRFVCWHATPSAKS